MSDPSETVGSPAAAALPARLAERALAGLRAAATQHAALLEDGALCARVGQVAVASDFAIVDSPGMKAFGLAHLDPEALAHAFVEMRPYLGRCRFRDCRHDREPGCAVAAAVAAGEIAPHRLALLHTLLREAGAKGA